MIRIEMDNGIEGKMDRIGRAINRAFMFTLSDAARFAKDDFLNEVKTRIDRPAPFTTRADGYGIIFARFDDPNPSSMLLIKDKQSGYLNYVIGRRKDRGRSDPGASAKHVWVPGQRPGVMVAGQYSIRQRFSRYGGVEDEYSQYLYMLAHQQFAQKVSRSLGMKAGAGDTKKAVYSTGGVFYGTISLLLLKTAPVQTAARRRSIARS